ncbi:MAG: hypothetical protein P9C36_06165 [Defluviicoccus sp.]|nr:hypothetical protein [Defluviicoccus sp.]MDG4592194.1 hypothetical protein [Defluviicoccus sp.]MDS4010789.1 hypothetical protein [Defluviicoccus sp.]MDS4073444.1 hypothetical protein [Defluviicoccus sp.]
MAKLAPSLAAFGLVVAAAAACTTVSPRITLLQTCDRYASTLTALAAAKAHGRLSAQQIDAVDTVRLGLNPICESPPVLDDSVAAVLPQVTEGVRQLLSIEAQVEIANDAR